MNRPTDDLDELTLPQRPRRPDPRPDLRAEVRSASREDMVDDLSAQDREFTLSTGTVLALFFGLALVCAVFFGFGYSMGRKSAAAAAVTDTASTSAADSSSTGAADPTLAANKPSAGSPVIQTIPSYQSQGTDTVSRAPATSPVKVPSPIRTDATSVTVPVDTPSVKPPRPARVADPDAQIVEAPKPTAVKIAPATAPTPTSATAPGATSVTPAAGGSNYVQIAAVSHKEDADVLLSALKRRGYTVFTRPGDADKLIHVQVGPFATKKDAEAMRLRLQGDGYNAILK